MDTPWASEYRRQRKYMCSDDWRLNMKPNSGFALSRSISSCTESHSNQNDGPRRLSDTQNDPDNALLPQFRDFSLQALGML